MMVTPESAGNGAAAAGPVVGVALKWAALRLEVDPLSGATATDPRFSGASAADEAALEWALRLAEAWDGQVVAVTAGPPEADGLLRQALAVGAGRAVRCTLAPGAPSEQVAATLAGPLADAALVVCGDYSADRGSGTVPAFLAEELGAAQALGLVTLEPEIPATVRPRSGSQQMVRPRSGRHLMARPDSGSGCLAVRAERRLDGGRRERLRVTAPAVLSVEGAAARLRRAQLTAVLRSRTAAVEERAAPLTSPQIVWPTRRQPYRPRPKILPPPASRLSARERTLSLTGALEERTPPQTVTAAPEEAAERILSQLREWGYRWGDDAAATE